MFLISLLRNSAFFLSLLLVFSCGSSRSEQEKEFGRISSRFIQSACKKYDLACSGSGGSIPVKIRAFSVVFKYRNEKSIDELRQLCLGLVDDFKKLIEETPEIHQYLENYPVNDNNFDFMLALSKRQEYSSDTIALTILDDGKIRYFNNDESTPRGRDVVYRETVGEAREKLGL